MNKLIAVFLVMAGFSSHAQQVTLPGMGGEVVRDPVRSRPPAAALPVETPGRAENLQLAISDPQYPVTPGDVYTLTFLRAGTAISNTLQVESDYTINMTIFGKLNARGMTFSQLKPAVEKIIADAYTGSLPSLTIASVGVFKVPVQGAIPEVRFITVWGLSRLSEVLQDTLGTYSSIRDVEIISENGQSRTYDLLMALNQGILSQNPRVRPGDTIVVKRIQRVVRVRGEVYSAGDYQLLENEGIEDLVKYTRGFTSSANSSRIRVERFSDERPVTFFLNYNDPGQIRKFEIRNDDVMTIPTRKSPQPVVYVEGGISIRDGSATAPAFVQVPDTLREEVNRVSHPLSEGETLFDVLETLRDSISPFVNLENGYVIRGDELLPVNMQNLLYRSDMSENIVLKTFDRIIIPVDRPVIYVTGAAAAPGRFPYNAREGYQYYVSLAGGFDSLRNNNDRVTVTDKNGHRRDPSALLRPGDTVNVLSNNFLFNFNRHFPAIATGLGFILTIIAISNALNQGSIDTVFSVN